MVFNYKLLTNIPIYIEKAKFFRANFGVWSENFEGGGKLGCNLLILNCLRGCLAVLLVGAGCLSGVWWVFDKEKDRRSGLGGYK